MQKTKEIKRKGLINSFVPMTFKDWDSLPDSFVFHKVRKREMHSIIRFGIIKIRTREKTFKKFRSRVIGSTKKCPVCFAYRA